MQSGAPPPSSELSGWRDLSLCHHGNIHHSVVELDLWHLHAKWIWLWKPFILDTEKGCNREDACRCDNELVHQLIIESKKQSGRQSAAPSWHGGSQPHIIMSKTTKLHLYSWTHSSIMIRSVFTYPSLRRCCPSQVASLSFRRVSPYQVSVSSNHHVQLKPCSCRGVAECGDPSISMLIRINRWQVFQLGCNPAPTFCKTHSTKLQVSVHGLTVQMFRSQVSTVLISTNWSHLDVAIDYETLQP